MRDDDEREMPVSLVVVVVRVLIGMKPKILMH